MEAIHMSGAAESVFESFFDRESGVWSLRRVAATPIAPAVRAGVPARAPISGTYKRVVVRKRAA